ncbi:MAG: hypothetical protein JW744_03970 [Candidatus Diapherotrites archaeon]|uniref:Type II toxin-antitoxin system RelE/ParE family toxin n=1 Tax=Candidatus Iainarchaeum sp. TaxID=3101447 RepID=A0A938YWU6_9ARCH|nr:hypothetical protein [Candidatus Diapherotrites archaeon]
MKQKARARKIAFIDPSLKKAFEELKSGKYEDQQLASFLNRAMEDLMQDPLCGIRIPTDLWPKGYIQKYHINNLRKYDLPNGWRLLYTVRGNEVEIISILIEWISHKDYERKFGYKRS